ncbi:hypothetical protein [Mesorhizobium kowhaii]|uniref:hypothetical protein n=1 Tax=Mesorhizobium kowhaii TaxID=1300272 RepID=UPI001FDFF9AF|nr:hypothetical protein [Mesorhizobium kowhaii]
MPLHNSFQNGAVFRVERAPFLPQYSFGRRDECRKNLADEVTQQTRLPVVTDEEFPDGCFEHDRLRGHVDLREIDPRLQLHYL